MRSSRELEDMKTISKRHYYNLNVHYTTNPLFITGCLKRGPVLGITFSFPNLTWINEEFKAAICGKLRP